MRSSKIEAFEFDSIIQELIKRPKKASTIGGRALSP